MANNTDLQFLLQISIKSKKLRHIDAAFLFRPGFMRTAAFGARSGFSAARPPRPDTSLLDCRLEKISDCGRMHVV
jgi:hypothetical protein